MIAFLRVLSPVYSQVAGNTFEELNKASTLKKIDSLHTALIGIWLNYPERAMAFGRQALMLSESINDSANISKSLRLIAGVHYYKGDFDTSLDYNIKALDIATKIRDSSLINNSFNNLGLLYYNLGSYQVSLEYLLKSIQIKKKRGEEYGLATTLNNIGLVYEHVGDWQTARQYFVQALEVSVKQSLKDQEVYSLNNIGTTYLHENELEAAYGAYASALKLANSIDNVNWGAASKRGLGQYFVKLGALDSAEHYFTLAINASSSIEDKTGLAEGYYYLADLYFIKGRYNDALGHLEVSQEYAKRLRLRRQIVKNLRMYTKVYQQIGTEGQIIAAQAEYSHFRDSIFADIMIRNLNLVPLKIQDEEDRIRFAQQQSELQRKEFLNQVFVVILIIFIPLIVMLFLLLRRNIITNKQLVANNEALKEAQGMLIKSEKMASLGVLAAGVGHEINNPLNFIQNGLLGLKNEIASQYGGISDHLQPYIDIINEGVARSSSIVKSLSSFSRVGADLNDDCNLHDIIDNCLVILNNKLKIKVELIKHYAHEPIIVKGNSGKLHQVFMNIIANAEQAIEKQGTISITTTFDHSSAKVVIEDDGIGIPPEHLQKIADPFFTTKDPGKGTGLGLFITYSIVHEHGGDIHVQSGTEGGTKFEVVLPLKSSS